MDKHGNLPFKVGQLAEAKSFQPGFRGAWFRCEIKEISWKNGHVKHALQYYDFPDEKVKWTKLYQVPPNHGGKSKDTKRQLMVRPQYPPLYSESEMPEGYAIPEVAVVVEDVWKVGDLVDWWTDGCYWSGKVTQILGKDKVQIELPPSPVGEGSSYEVFCKDLRPSLNWSPEYGWTLPTLADAGNCSPCARLISKVNQAAGSLSNLENQATDVGLNNDVLATAGSSFNASISSHTSACSKPGPEELKNSRTMESLNQPLISKDMIHIPETNLELGMRESGTGKTSLSDSVSSSNCGDTSAETAGQNTGEDLNYCRGSMKKLRTSGGISLNSMRSDTLEAAIMDMEELANKVKWLKGILEFVNPMSDAARPSWKFVEHRASSMPK